MKYSLRKLFREKVNFATPTVRFVHLCQLFLHSNAGSVLRLLFLKTWCPPPLEMTEKPPSLIILNSRARLAEPWCWVCPGHTPSQAQPFGCTTIQHCWTFLEKGQGPGEICCDVYEVPRDDDKGMQPAGREGALGDTSRKNWERKNLPFLMLLR